MNLSFCDIDTKSARVKKGWSRLWQF